MLDQQMDCDPERLRMDLARVREDLAKIGATVAEIARERLRAAARSRTETAQTEIADAARKVNARIDAYPAASLLAAFGVGLLLSRLLGRRR